MMREAESEKARPGERSVSFEPKSSKCGHISGARSALYSLRLLELPTSDCNNVTSIASFATARALGSTFDDDVNVVAEPFHRDGGEFVKNNVTLKRRCRDAAVSPDVAIMYRWAEQCWPFP